jgi:hypothetical protein
MKPKTWSDQRRRGQKPRQWSFCFVRLTVIMGDDSGRITLPGNGNTQDIHQTLGPRKIYLIVRRTLELMAILPDAMASH